MIVLGDTLVLAGIAASISKDPGNEVVAHALPAGRPELCAIQPDVVIFDLDAVQPDFQYNLAQDLPGLLLIGVDSKTNRVVLWRGQPAEGLSSQNLAQIIYQTKSQGNT